ncbi:Glycosyltransferase, GT2 family [Pseudobutyrivibrio sp. ACV-2]|uniref:glycosyltransferase n=1 Tax=Pseudobutyrivibrio sp. ACV-2 TaxID=1520801 RepID=UPI00089AC299|nr:glycosyltransferase [Pseudobutyrivibrio sp. ACV-2]SEB00583.1 Glycosyltransferase, GT2 family [Pseudobutyrivibrio sp. ACV-2]
MIDKSVDIIIPIYNAADDLEICLESIYKHTDLSKNRLVLINDNSPDPRIKEILDRQIGDNIIVINNEKNQGFSANINLGMQQSVENDVILLNSDTVVTDRWVEKMVVCAYSNPEIGTVTPLSNNATLCSVPVFCEENKLPENIDAEKMGEIVEHCSMHKYPQISVAHGFCMLVKREVIDLIGNFDAATFGRGYGEENDFCNRAEQVGYIHVQCDDTFILHTGTKSFVSAEKEAYIREHDAILRKRYPLQMHTNDVYVRDNPNGYVQENVSIFMDVENGKKNILYVVHTDFRKDASDNVGGTQLHVNHLKDSMVSEYNVFVAARDGEFLNLTLYTDKTEHFWKFYIGEYKGYFRFHDRNISRIWNLVFGAFKFDLVHVHHVHSLSFDIFDIAFAQNVPVVVTCHDYFFVSPSVKLLDADFMPIDSKTVNDEVWQNALGYWADIYNGTDYIKLWQKKSLDVLSKCSDIIVPNVSVKENMGQFYPELFAKIKVIEHGYEFKTAEVKTATENGNIEHFIESVKKTPMGYVIEGWAILDESDYEIESIYLEINIGDKATTIPTTTVERGDIVNAKGFRGKSFKTLIPFNIFDIHVSLNLLIRTSSNIFKKNDIYELDSVDKSNNSSKLINIGFIGGINREKGGSIICDLIKKHIPNVNYYILGNIGYDDLNLINADNVYKFGQYNSNDLPKLLSLYNIDAVGILSVWPETFSYTLSESLICDMPTIVTDIGALGERMKRTDAGWTVTIDDAAGQIANIIHLIQTDRNVLDVKKTSAKNYVNKTLSMMAKEYQTVYENLFNEETRQSGYGNFNAEELYKCYMKRTFFIDTAEKMDGIMAGISQADKDILNSFTFKVAKKIRSIDIPFKVQLWRLLNKSH